MTDLEKRFVNLAMDYLIHAKDKDIYSSDLEEYLNVALAILDTMKENRNERKSQVCEFSIS